MYGRGRLALGAATLVCVAAACFDPEFVECESDADCCAIALFTRCIPALEGNRCVNASTKNPACPGGYCDTNVIPPAVSLPVPELPQLCSEWCWAATATMVMNYYGLEGNQCRAVDPVGACCGDGVCETECNHPGRPDYALTFNGFYGVRVLRELTESELQHELANGRPVIAHYIGAQISHFVVISGYRSEAEQPTLYHVIDPLNWSEPWSTGVGPYVADLPYWEVYDGPTGAEPWSITYAMISPRLDGCSPVTNPTCACTLEL